MSLSTTEAGIRSAQQVWQGASLPQLQVELDGCSNEITTLQLSSKDARKKLSDMTKEFRKAPDAKKLEDIKPLLKAYQAEIDNLTKRTKSSETLVLKVYSSMGELPDPAPILSTSLQELQDLKSSTGKLSDLTTKLQEANRTVTNLQEKLKAQEALQEQFDRKVQDQLSMKELDLTSEFEEGRRRWEAREKSLEAEVAQLTQQIATLEDNEAQAQSRLLESSVHGADHASSHIAQLDLVLGELDRARDQVSALHRENEELKQQAGNQPTSPDPKSEQTTKPDSLLKKRLAKQEAEMTRMLDQLEQIKAEQASKDSTHSQAIQKVQRSLKEKDEKIGKLTSQLSEMKDYNQIKDELDALKRIEFPEEYEASHPSGTQPIQTNESETVMAAIARKSQLQQQTITQLQNDHRNAISELTETRVQLAESQEQIQKLISLNAKLESDLMTTPASPTPQPDEVALTKSESSHHHSGNLLPIVTSQRDRFRARNLELEETIRSSQNEMETLQKSVASLRADNLQLYEQLKYAGDYSRQATGNNGLTSRTLTPASSSRDVSDRYSSLYDEAKNPFQEFRQREATRRYQTLHPTDRAALSLMRLFLTNHITRAILILYLLSLHLLVVLTLYHFAHHT